VSDTSIQLASIGVGWWGSELADAVERSGVADIVACYSVSQESRNAFASRHHCRSAESLEVLLDDPSIDGLLIATPHTTHEEMIIKAARARKHIFVEKPLALTVSAARAAIRAAVEESVVLQVGHHRRRTPTTRYLREAIDEGSVGRLQLLEANMSRPANLSPRAGWRQDPVERPLGGMTALGIHMADSLIYLAGPIARVSAMTARILGNTPLDDVTTVIVEFECGALGYIGTSLSVPATTTIQMYGSAAMVASNELHHRIAWQPIDRDQPTVSQLLPESDPVAEQMVEFVESIKTGAPPEVDGEAALQVVAFLEACILSCRQLRTVSIAEVLSA
jgi:predicted dehydrogenase